MSRSYKKHGIIKDGGHSRKQVASRRLRHRNKQRVRLGLYPFIPHEITNQWDICDYKTRWDGDLIQLREAIEDHEKYPRLYPEDPITYFRERKRQYFNK